jgi:hypothetical protein
MYRGDQSDSLSNIMGMGYQPQAATSQMANTAVSSGMSAGAQIKATAMNNSTQMAIAGMNNNIAQQRLRMDQKQNTITNALNEDKFGLEMQRFGASESDRVFGQQEKVARYNLDVKRDNRVDAGTAKTDADARLAADADWDMRGLEIDEMLTQIDPNDITPAAAAKKAALMGYKQKIAQWRKDPNSVNYLKSFNASRMSNPLFGLIKAQGAATPAAPTYQAP